MTLDRACIIKGMARQLLRDYGHAAYEAFCQKNPGARWKAYEKGRAQQRQHEQEQDAELLARELVIPALCSEWGRVYGN